MAKTNAPGRPERTECQEYYFMYIDRVPDRNVLEVLQQQLDTTPAFLTAIEPAKLEYRYGPGKWCIKEIVGHLVDVERTFSYRAMCAARGEPADLPSLEQEPYIENSRYGLRPMNDIVREYRTVREASLALFESFDDDEWMRRVKACGWDFTARTFPFIIAGHEMHHRGVIEDKYLA